jgi:hypothetical protein
VIGGKRLLNYNLRLILYLRIVPALLTRISGGVSGWQVRRVYPLQLTACFCDEAQLLKMITGVGTGCQNRLSGGAAAFIAAYYDYTRACNVRSLPRKPMRCGSGDATVLSARAGV